MAWIYLAESAESAKPCPLGCERLPTVKETPTLKVCSCRECYQAISNELQFGMMSHRLGEQCYRVSTSSSVASLARTSRLRAVVQAWRASDPVSSLRSCDSSANANPRLSSSKTFRPFALADYIPSSKSFPISGTTRGGLVYPLKKLERIISETDGFCLLPTPTASRYGTGNNGCPGDGRKEYATKGRLSLHSMALKNLWPTPTVKGNYNSPKTGTRRGFGLESAARMWPTPRASDGAKGGPNQRGSKGDLNLPAAVIHWRTPMASDWKNRSSDANRSKRGGQIQLQSQVGGQLNPTWVEWLMGFPLEWTVLDVSVTPWFLSKRKQLSKNSRASNDRSIANRRAS